MNRGIADEKWRGGLISLKSPPMSRSVSRHIVRGKLVAAAGCALVAGTLVTGSLGTGALAAGAAGVRISARDGGASALATPVRNLAPSAAFLQACANVGPTVADQRRCVAAALPSFDAARAAEGVGPLALPAGFAAMSPAVQLLTVIDLERVARGLPAVRSLSPYLDSLAAWGASHSTDPPLPAGRGGGSNWAGGVRSTLLSTFLWLYDDGPGSMNIDCPTPGAAGCWGHRRNILATYANLELMGASSEGPSLAMLVVAGGGLSQTGPTWGAIAAHIPVHLSARAVTAAALPGHVAGRHVTVWGTASTTLVRASIAGGGAAWHLVHTTCHVGAGRHCNLWFAYRPTTASASSAQLVVQGAGGRQVVALHGRP